MVYHDIKPIQTHWEGCWKNRSHWRCAVARVERLERELKECREKASGWFDKAERCFESERELKRELRECREALAAAEARERRWRGVLESLQHADGCYCDAAFAGPGCHPSHAPECQKARALLDQQPDHTALDAALEARSVEMLEHVVNQLSEGITTSERYWTNEEFMAWHRFLDAKDSALEQAREAGYRIAMEGTVEGLELEDAAVVADIWQRGKKAGEEEYRTKWLAAANGVDSLKEECERLECALKTENAEANQWHKNWHVCVGRVKSLEADLAAAEARERNLLTWLGDEWRYSCSESGFCALCGAYEGDGHEPGCPWRQLRDADHAALDAALEQARAKGYSVGLADEQRLREDVVEQARAEGAAEEKERRIYYQKIVYGVCNWIDRMLGRQPSKGTGTVCGTFATPSNGVRDGLCEVAKRHRQQLDRAAEASAEQARAGQFKLGQKDAERRLMEPMPCGHPTAAFHCGDEPLCCFWCESLEQARAEERERLREYHQEIGDIFTAAGQTPYRICKQVWSLHADMERELAISETDDT